MTKKDSAADHSVSQLSEDDIGTRFTWHALEDPNDKDRPYTAVLVKLERNPDTFADDGERLPGSVATADFKLDRDGTVLQLAADEPIWYVQEPPPPAGEGYAPIDPPQGN